VLETPPLAELLRQYRAEARLSQEELAERARVSPRTIGDIETGVSLRPRAITISLIAQALELESERRETLRVAARRREPAGNSAAALPQSVPLVGRDDEILRIRALLLESATRLVTLTGGPGVGKTALAIAAARQIAGEFGDRAFFIEFAALPDAALVPTKIALALDVRYVQNQSVTASLAAAIAESPILLVFDNFERVVAAAPMVAELLAAAPSLKVLVTSRMPLRLSTERVVKVGQLSPAFTIRLLLDRVRVSAPEFEPALHDPDLERLAGALGGVPLAIELAAPLLRTASLAELVSRLEHPLDVLDAMRDSIAWSYGLLGPDEQRLLRRLAVFDGPFTESAAHRIGGSDESGKTPFDTLRAISTLIDHGLVGVSDDGAEEIEFDLHPLVCEYAKEALDREHENDAAHLSLTDYCTDLVHATPRPEPLHDPATRARLNRESAHFDAVLGWLRMTGRISLALKLAFELWLIWYRRGENAHGHAWLCSLIAAADTSESPIDDALLADAHWAAGGLAEASGQLDEAERHAAFALPLKRAAGDRTAVASLLAGLGVRACASGEYEAARTLLEESLAIRRELGDGLNVARALTDLGSLAADEGRYEEANARLEEALSGYRTAGRRMGASLALGLLGLVALRSGAPAQAEPLAREAVRVAEEVGYGESARAAKIVLSRALADLGDFDGGATLALDVALEDDASLEQRAGIARALASIEFRRGRASLTARLLGAATTSSPAFAIPMVERADHERLLDSTARALGGRFEREFEAGRAGGLRAVLAPDQFRE
jgi:predicted ATPase/DNA-binding XRE family transcriptional regulator